MLNSSSHWRAAALNLAGEYTVIAPDLIGHGDSAAPRGDYSLGAHADARGAFLHTLRSVIDIKGQRVSATDRLYLLESLPTMIVWGERDNTIPPAHGRSAHEAIPHSRFRTLAAAAHFPRLDDPDWLSQLLREFMRTTQPGAIEDGDWGAILARRSLPSRRIGNAA
jgi:pimeloyl-ACP methyl ester carboxylesterase